MILNTVSKAVTAATSPSITYLGAQLSPFLRMPGGLFNKMRMPQFGNEESYQPSTVDTMLNNLENQQFNNPMNPRTDDMLMPQQIAQMTSSSGEEIGGNSSDILRQVNSSIARMSQVVAKGNEINRAGFERLFGSSNAAVRGIIDLRDVLNKQQYMLQALIENTSNTASLKSNTEATDANTINMIDLLERIAIASEQHLLLDKLKSGVSEHGTIRKSAVRNSLTRFDPYDTGSASKEDIYEQMLEESRKSNQALIEVRDSLTYKAFRGVKNASKSAVKTIAKSPFTAVKGIWKYSTKRVLEEGATNIKAKMMAKREERENKAIQEYAEAVKNGDEQAKKAAKYKLKRAGVSDYITNKLDYGASPSSVALFKDRVSKRNDAATFDKEVRDTIVNGIPLLLSEIVKAINGSDVKYNYGTGSLTDTDTKISTEVAMSKERVLDLQNKRSKMGFLRKDNAWNDYKELNEARRNVENMELIQKNQHGKIDLYGNTIKSIHDEHDKRGVKSYKDMADFFKNTSGSLNSAQVIGRTVKGAYDRASNIQNSVEDWISAKYKKIRTGQDTYNEFNSIDDISKSPIDIVRLLRNNGVDDDKISAEISEKYGTSRISNPSLLSSINNMGSNTTDLTVLEDNTTENNVLLKEIIEILNNWRWGRKGGGSVPSVGPISPNNNQQQIHTVTKQNNPWSILPNITVNSKMYNSPIGPNPLNINQYHQPIGPSPLQNNGIKNSPLSKISNAYQNLKSSIGDKLQSLNPVTYFKNKFASIKEAKLKKAEEKSYKHIESTDKSIHKIEKMMSKHYRWLRGKAFMSLLGSAISTGLGFLGTVFGGLKDVLGSLGTILGIVGSAIGLKKLKDLFTKFPIDNTQDIQTDVDIDDKNDDKKPKDESKKPKDKFKKPKDKFKKFGRFKPSLKGSGPLSLMLSGISFVNGSIDTDAIRDRTGYFDLSPLQSPEDLPIEQIKQGLYEITSNATFGIIDTNDIGKFVETKINSFSGKGEKTNKELAEEFYLKNAKDPNQLKKLSDKDFAKILYFNSDNMPDELKENVKREHERRLTKSKKLQEINRKMLIKEYGGDKSNIPRFDPITGRQIGGWSETDYMRNKMLGNKIRPAKSIFGGDPSEVIYHGSQLSHVGTATQISANISNIKPSENRIPKVVNTEQQSPRTTFYQLKDEEEKPKKLFYNSETGILSESKEQTKTKEIKKEKSSKVEQETKNETPKPKVKKTTKIVKQVENNKKTVVNQSPSAQAKKVAEKFVKDKVDKPRLEGVGYKTYSFKDFDFSFINKDLTNDKNFMEAMRSIDALEINDLETRHNMLASVESEMLKQLFEKYGDTKKADEFNMLAAKVSSVRYIPDEIKDMYMSKLKNHKTFSTANIDFKALENKLNNFRYDFEGNKGKRLNISFVDKDGNRQSRKIKVFDKSVNAKVNTEKGLKDIYTKIDYSDDKTFNTQMEMIDTDASLSNEAKTSQKGMVELQRAIVIMAKYKTVDNFKDYNLLRGMILGFKYIDNKAKDSLLRRLDSITILDKEMKSLKYVKKNPFKEIQYNKSAKIKELEKVKTYSINGRQIQTKKDFTDNDTFYNTLDSINSNTNIDEVTRKSMLSSVETARVIQKLEKISKIKDQDQYNEFLTEISSFKYAKIPELLELLNNKTDFKLLSSTKNDVKIFEKNIHLNKERDNLFSNSKYLKDLGKIESIYDLRDKKTYDYLMGKYIKKYQDISGFEDESVLDNEKGTTSNKYGPSYLEKEKFSQLLDGIKSIDSKEQYDKFINEIGSFKYISKQEREEMFALVGSLVTFDDNIRYGKGSLEFTDIYKKRKRMNDGPSFLEIGKGINKKSFSNKVDFTNDEIYNAYMTNNQGNQDKQYEISLTRLAQNLDKKWKEIIKDKDFLKKPNRMFELLDIIDKEKWLDPKDRKLFHEEWQIMANAYHKVLGDSLETKFDKADLHSNFRKNSSSYVSDITGSELAFFDLTDNKAWNKLKDKYQNANLDNDSKETLKLLQKVRLEQYSKRKEKINKKEFDMLADEIEFTPFAEFNKEEQNKFMAMISGNSFEILEGEPDLNQHAFADKTDKIINKMSNGWAWDKLYNPKNINADMLTKLAKYRSGLDKDYFKDNKRGYYALSDNDVTAKHILKSSDLKHIKDKLGIDENANINNSLEFDTLVFSIKADAAYDVLIDKMGISKEDINEEMLSYTIDGNIKKVRALTDKVKAKYLLLKMGIKPTDSLIKNVLEFKERDLGRNLSWNEMTPNLIASMKTSDNAAAIMKELNKENAIASEEKREVSVLNTNKDRKKIDVKNNSSISAFQAQNKGKIHKATFAEPKNGNEPSAFGSKTQQAVFVEPETGNQTSLGVPNLSEKVAYPWNNNYVSNQIQKKDNSISNPKVTNQRLDTNTNTVTNNIFVVQGGKLHKVDTNTKTTNSINKSDKPINMDLFTAAKF